MGGPAIDALLVPNLGEEPPLLNGNPAIFGASLVALLMHSMGL